MSPVEITLLFFGSMFALLALGVPLAIALGGISVILSYILWGPGAISMPVMRAFSTTSGFAYVAIPLFIFMANMLERSGIAEDLFTTIHRLAGRMAGGLAAGTVGICTIFAAMAGISGAATVAMGIVALPAMLSRGYSKTIALGSIAAGGSLGILIPPSVTMIVYGLIANASVGQLYAGGLMPGLLLAVLFAVYILIRSRLNPQLAPPAPDAGPLSARELLASLKGIIVPVLLVAAVLGSILSGFTSIAEAAAVGAFGSIVATVLKKGFDLKMFHEAAVRTLLLSCLIFWIVIGAGAFSTLYTAMGASSLIRELVLDLEVNRYVILLAIMLILIVLGMMIDTVGIIMITVPIFVPIVTALGFDPIWFGVLFIINMEIGFLTPPFGYNLFYLKGVAPNNVTMLDIYKSVMPFVALMIVGLGLCIIFPDIILGLPTLLFR